MAGIAYQDTDPQSDFWVGFYRGINRANIFMEKVSLAGLESTLEEKKIAEAKFMRAFYYYNLVKLFGEVPLHLVPTSDFNEVNTHLPRSPITDVYDAIIEDLKYAETRLPLTQPVGQASAGAAKALLGKVYLTMAGKPLEQTEMYALAASKLKEIEGDYILEDNFSDVFAKANENSNTEVIFSRAAISNFPGAGTGLTYFAAAPKTPYAQWNGGGQFQFSCTETFYNSFNSNDVRRDVTMMYSYTNIDGVPIEYNSPSNPTNSGVSSFPIPASPYTGIPFGKLKETEAITGDPFQHGTDIIYIRYADVLLMIAESLNESGSSPEALIYLNKVRLRANLVDETTTDQSDLRDAIKQERKWELAGEHVEYYDLQRWGDIEASMTVNEDTQSLGASYNIRCELLPIPRNQIEANPNLLPQNPGYE